MCGRFTLKASPKELYAFFEELGNREWLESARELIADWPARYNVAPTQQVLVIRQHDVLPMRWGLIPSWADDEKIGYKMINARAETITEKPTFRRALEKKRCLIVADGFYEWQTLAPKQKQPLRFALADGKPFCFAGVWDKWKDLHTCTIITAAANSVVSQAHDRMPVMLDRSDFAAWLGETPTDQLTALLRPFPSERLQATKANPLVNNVANDNEACLQW
jgi:putative SOS response-associated peptidase YedK